MPTFGWVHEDAWERILSATEPAPEPGGPRLPTFPCPFCSMVLHSATAFQAHLSDAHHVARPMLLIEGREPSSTHLIRRRFRAQQVAITNATSAEISVDRGPFTSVTPKQLAATIAGLVDGCVRVHLQNASQRGATPVQGAYELDIRVISPAALEAVEQAFKEHLNSDNPSLRSIDEFMGDRRCQGLPSDYAKGFAEYVDGLLIKERPSDQGITSPLARYRELFGSALLKLSPYQRPLPRLLCALMRFALNDFSGAGTMTGHIALDAATMAMRGPDHLGNVPIAISGARRPVCPIDHGTSRILALCERLFAERRWSPVLGDECRQVASAGTLDLMDQQKALALWAVVAWRLGAKRAAVEPLESISAIYPFSTWASECLEAVTA
jgi:hypothetical protein